MRREERTEGGDYVRAEAKTGHKVREDRGSQKLEEAG